MQNRVHCILKANEFIRRGSRILKWGVNFCNNVIEPINIWGIRKKRKKGAQKKGGENSPISPPLDPCLFIENSICIILFKTWFTCLDKENISIYNLNCNISLLFDNDKHSIFQSSEKNWFQFHLEVWCFQPKAAVWKQSL